MNGCVVCKIDQQADAFKMYRKQLPASLLKQKYDRLKSQLLDPKAFPIINKFLNLGSFVRENESLFIRLISELKELKNAPPKRSDRNQTKVKTSPFYLNSSVQSLQNNKQDQRLKQIKAKNENMRRSLAALQEENSKRIAFQAPLIKEKQKLVKQRTQQLQKLNELGQQLSRALQNQQVLELYELKCRECESLRTINNETSEEIKALILELNKLTGSEENPNMFLMNLKV